MLITEPYTIPEQKSERIIARICDLCGFKTPCESWYDKSWDFDDTTIKITIERNTGSRYPEGGYSTNTEIDLCPECFKNKLIPWLKSQGALIKDKDINW